MPEVYDALSATFRFYAATWVIGRDTPYCSQQCAQNDGSDDGD